MRLGVVVLNWNGRTRLQSCLDALDASDPGEHFTVVVDNGSADGSADLVRQRGGADLVALAENRRFAEGNNAGAARAIELGATHLLILNNDATVLPETLGALARGMEEGGWDLAGPRIVFDHDPDLIWYGGGRFDPRTGYLGHRAIRARVGQGGDPAGPTDWVTGCALAIRADLWQRLEGFDPGFYIYSEDVDLCLRARALGARIGYCPRALVRHEVSASVGGNASAFKAYHRTRARRQLMRRHGRGWFWPVGIWMQDAAWAALRALGGEFDAARAVLAAMAEDPAAPPRFRVEDLDSR